MIPAIYKGWIELLRSRGREVTVTIEVGPGRTLYHVSAPPSRWFDSYLGFGFSVPNEGGRSRFLGLSIGQVSGRLIRVKSKRSANISIDVYSSGEGKVMINTHRDEAVSDIMLSRTSAKKYQGDCSACWAVFLDGRPVVSGLTRSEVPRYRRQVAAAAYDRTHKKAS